MEYFPDNLKVLPLLIDKHLAIGTVGPKCLGVDLHSCTTLGSGHVMTYCNWNSLQLFSAQSMQMYAWSYGITLFHLLFSVSSLFPLYSSVYMSMSASLYNYHLFLHPFGSLCECISCCGVFF